MNSKCTESNHIQSWLNDYLPNQIDTDPHWSAHLLALVPALELNKSEAELHLLLQDTLKKQSLPFLFDENRQPIDDEKRQWLERKIALVLANSDEDYPQETLTQYVNTLSSEGIFFTLRHIKQTNNALHLFHALLNHELHREILFNGTYESDFHHFLLHIKPEIVLSCYLNQYFETSWFAQGLAKFAFFGDRHQYKCLLSQALELASNNALIIKLLTNNELAEVILKDFFKDSLPKPVQLATNPEINNFAKCVNKMHLLASISHLNKTSYWEDQASYKLVLYLLHSQFDKYFLTAQAEELHDLARFISRHLSKKRKLDKDQIIGRTVLSDLIFCSAKAGLVTVFYHKKQFNSAIAAIHFKRSTLETLVDKYSYGSLIPDWQTVITNACDKLDIDKLPIMVVFLLNYSGHKQPVFKLLHRYFHTYQQQRDHIHAISNLMVTLAHRDISHLIFDFLIDYLQKHPQILDSTLLHDMAYFYSSLLRNNNRSLDVTERNPGSIGAVSRHLELHSAASGLHLPPSAELDLLMYFGRCKYYALVARGCEELSSLIDDEELQDRLAQAELEAQIEQYLSWQLGSFFFILIKFWLRLWYYGWNSLKNASQIVTFCDDNSPAPHHVNAPEQIKVGMATNNNIEEIAKQTNNCGITFFNSMTGGHVVNTPLSTLRI